MKRGKMLMNELKNLMEDLVLATIEDVLADTNVCKCEMCKLDIEAIALNSLPPLYFVTDKGKLFSKLNILKNQFEIDIISAITSAATKVKLKPRHDVPVEQVNEKMCIVAKDPKSN